MPTTTFLPTDGSTPITTRARQLLQDALATVPPDKQGAFLTAVEVKDGQAVLTVAVATRAFHGWQAATWVRTDFQDVSTGAAVQRTW